MSDKLMVSSGEFDRIKSNLVCVYREQFDDDSKVILNEYKSLFERGVTPKLTEIENAVIDINWQVSYEAAEYLAYNDPDFIEARLDYIQLGTEIDEGDANDEYISEEAGNLFNELYWHHTGDIRTNIREILTELFVVFDDDLPDDPIISHFMRQYSPSEMSIYANNSQIILFEDVYKWQYGPDALVHTDNGHLCNYLIQRCNKSNTEVLLC